MSPFKHKTTLALAALAAATGTVLSGCSTPASSTPASTHAATSKPARDLSPSPPSGFVEKKVSVDGTRLNYVKGGHGPTLLLIAGYPQTWYAWDDILHALAQHYTVVAPDLPGTGGSDAPVNKLAYAKK